MKLCHMPSFLNHTSVVMADRLCTHRAVHERADFQKLILERIAFLRNQRGICCNAIQYTCAGGIANLFYVGGIEEEFHSCSPLYTTILPLRGPQGRAHRAFVSE